MPQIHTVEPTCSDISKSHLSPTQIRTQQLGSHKVHKLHLCLGETRPLKLGLDKECALKLRTVKPCALQVCPSKINPLQLRMRKIHTWKLPEFESTLLQLGTSQRGTGSHSDMVVEIGIVGSANAGHRFFGQECKIDGVRLFLGRGIARARGLSKLSFGNNIRRGIPLPKILLILAGRSEPM